MKEILLQYMLIIFLFVGLGYLIFLIKDKGLELYKDYFGLTYAILNTLNSDERTKENIKNILRIIGKAVEIVEKEDFNMPNLEKENKALKISRKLLNKYGFESPIDDESIRYIIRISATMLPSKKLIDK